MTDVTHLTEPLLEFAMCDLRPSPRARDIVRLSAVDWAACGIAGLAEGTFTHWVSRQASYGYAPTFYGEPLTAPAAALVNGTLSHALDFDDTHFAHIGHPSVVIFPALMAAKPRDWDAFEEAALVGIEASVRVGLALGRDHYQAGFHQTATAGAFGACLALIRLNDVPPDQARAALGVCATMASGLKAQFGTMGKPLNAGLAARAAVEATFWAQGGMTGPDAGLEAFIAAHGCHGAGALDGLGQTWHVDDLSHKFHACCHGLHATLEALRDVDGTDVEAVEVQTHPRWMSVCNTPNPDTGLAAKFSYRHVVAMALSGIATGDAAVFTDDMARDAKLVALRDRVRVTEDGDLTEMQARVRIETKAGPRVVDHDLAAPVAVPVLTDRLRAKAKVLVGEDTADSLFTAMQARDFDAYAQACFPAKPIRR